MTLEEMQRRDLYDQVHGRGWDIPSANWVVDRLCGRRSDVGCVWVTREDSAGNEFQVWDREMHDDE